MPISRGCEKRRTRSERTDARDLRATAIALEYLQTLPGAYECRCASPQARPPPNGCLGRGGHPAAHRGRTCVSEKAQ